MPSPYTGKKMTYHFKPKTDKNQRQKKRKEKYSQWCIFSYR